MIFLSKKDMKFIMGFKVKINQDAWLHDDSIELDCMNCLELFNIISHLEKEKVGFQKNQRFKYKTNKKVFLI